MSDIEFLWLPKQDRSHFKLSPFELATAPGCFKKAGKSSRVLVSSWAGSGIVKRIGRVSDDVSRKAALELSEETGDPVIIGEISGVVGQDFEPVYQIIGCVTMAKENDPLSDDAWIQSVGSLSGRLSAIAEQEAEHLTQEALEWFDFDWNEATQSQWARAERGAVNSISSPRNISVGSQRVAIASVLAAVLSGVSSGTARLPGIRGNLGASFNLPDRKISQAMAAHHGFWVKDQYGRVSQRLARQAQPIIQNGINQGLGRNAIGKELERKISGGLQMSGYWRTVAANHITRARSYAMGYTMRAAGITHYKWESILDEATTEECLMLHGRTFPINAAMAAQDRILANPEPVGVLEDQPFVQHDGDEMFLERPDGERTILATVETPGRGTGVPGTYSNVASQQQMISGPVSFPPIHHACRSTIIAVV